MRELFTGALRLQEIQERSGFRTPNPALSRLLSQFDPETLLGHAHQLRMGDMKERQLHARLLADIDLPADRRLAEVLSTLGEESEPDVISWLVFAIRDTALPSALGSLRKLAEHPSPKVRFPIPDALSACATRFGDIADVLLALSQDVDAEVRWSATFELAAWWREEKDLRIEARLSQALADPSDEVRRAAAEAMRPHEST
jgi:hypothetical protein